VVQVHRGDKVAGTKGKANALKLARAKELALLPLLLFFSTS